MDMSTVTVSPKFQVVIPAEVRTRLALKPGMKMMVLEVPGGLRLMPVKPASAFRGIARGIDTSVSRESDRML
jgi:AbrB family looped-hinge helix DNA binding protein